MRSTWRAALVSATLLLPASAWAEPPNHETDSPAKLTKQRLRVGGTAQSEAAVAAGLHWLADHQAADGHWSLAEFAKHGKCKCNCSGPGGNHTIAGTALALLPLLSAGHTHRLSDKDSPYARHVQRGLQYLVSKLGEDGDFNSMMAEQGLATQALCLAYLQTRDAQLKGPAQRAVRFICEAQNDERGGWRYRPKMPADTEQSVWQMQALRIAHLAGFEVPRHTWDGMHRWLDHVAGDDEGAAYGYTTGERGTRRMSAAGLLCRQFLGWSPNYRGLKKGTELLLKAPPQPKQPDILHFYWTTQVMHHQGGSAWVAWHPRLRDLLVGTQDQGDGHSKGSWTPDGDPFRGPLGRLGVTALSLLILETYSSVDTSIAEERARESDPGELRHIWEDLGRPSRLTARQAVAALAEIPARAVPFLAVRSQPVSATVTPQWLAQLLGELDDRHFDTRQRALTELQKLGELAEADLRATLAKGPPLEVRQRIERILAEIERQGQTPERLQALRTVQALEAIATPQARDVLEKLAKGNPAARPTREAKAALERLR
jgi:hypothetical protein